MITEVLKNSSFKTLFKNFSYLSIIQILDILYPLVTYPYLIRILGGDLYGKIVFAQAVMAYVVITINFGFNVSAVRRVSENRENIAILCEIYSSVTYLKAGLLCISLLVLSAAYIFFEADILVILLLLIGMAIEEVLFPVWFFQGLEEMRYITIITFLAKTIYVIMILLMIKTESHYLYLPVIISFSCLITSVCSLVPLRKRGIKFIKTTKNRLKQDFKESLPFFSSRLSSVVMERTNVIIIGAFFDYSMVAIYDLCIKVVSIIRTPFGLASQVLYPHVAKNGNMNIVRKSYRIVLIIGVALALVVTLSSNLIVTVLSGDKLLAASEILKCMIWYVPIIGASYILGASTLVVKGFSKEYNLSVIYSLFIYLLMIVIFYLSNIINLYTITATMLVPELATLIYRRYIAKKNNIY